MQTAIMAFSPMRIYAMVLRYIYLLRRSWPRVLELAYWPTMQMILWGFISQYLSSNSSLLARVGCDVPLTAGSVHGFFRGDVFAQPRSSVRQSITAV
mgnify:CR=1 FL=1